MGTRPLLLGHRGTCRSASVRENTFNAFNLALTRGCDGFEFDVRLTADRVAVVCHDPEYRGTRYLED
jgi:glycerophosphoryl diester phosphodiesterase